MMPGNLLITQFHKACGIVVKDVALLLISQKWYVFHCFDGQSYGTGPEYLIGSK
jgi:hypothetical protein